MRNSCFFCLFCLLFLTNCGDETVENTIPQRPVNFRMDVSPVGADRELATPTAHKTFAQPRLAGEYVGFSGLLIYTSPNMIPNTNYYNLYAFDLCCPYEQDQLTKVSMQGDGTAKCGRCGSTYDVINGTGMRLSGPSKYGLQVYRCSQVGGETGIFRAYH